MTSLILDIPVEKVPNVQIQVQTHCVVSKTPKSKYTSSRHRFPMLQFAFLIPQVALLFVILHDFAYTGKNVHRANGFLIRFIHIDFGIINSNTR